MKRMRMVCVTLLFMVLPLWAFSHEKRVYPSPDGKLQAWVIPIGKNASGFDESRVEIHNAAGLLLLSKSYDSEDGEHGFGVVQANWTPDSQYFVYSVSSSGGHQSWHFPTYFYSRNRNNVKCLDDYTGPITESQFVLKPPDVISTAGRRKADLEAAVFEVSLHTLQKKDCKR